MAVTTAAVIGAGASAYSAYNNNKNAKKAMSQTGGPAWLENSSRGAIDRADQLSRRQYTPFTGNRVAGMSANETQAGQLAGGFSRALQPYQNRLSAGFSRGALEQFENPYLDKVLGARKRAIGEEFGRQSADLATNQAATDAFRTGRSDLMRSRLNDSRLRALDEAEGTARSGAFDQALQAYFAQGQQDIGAMGQTAAAQSQQIDNLGRTGAIDRSIRQAGLDFDYGQFLERRDWDVNNLTPLLNAIQSARGGTVTTTASDGSKGKDWWGAAGGLLGQAIALFGNNGSQQGAFPAAGETAIQNANNAGPFNFGD